MPPRAQSPRHTSEEWELLKKRQRRQSKSPAARRSSVPVQTHPATTPAPTTPAPTTPPATTQPPLPTVPTPQQPLHQEAASWVEQRQAVAQERAKKYAKQRWCRLMVKSSIFIVCIAIVARFWGELQTAAYTFRSQLEPGSTSRLKVAGIADVMNAAIELRLLVPPSERMCALIDIQYNTIPVLKTPSDADLHGRQTMAVETDSTKSLADKLTRPFPGNQLKQARAIFAWICANIAYDLDDYRQGKKSGEGPTPYLQQPATVLHRKKTVCDGYSRLLERLLTDAKIRSIRLTNDEHAWNAINIDGAWHMVDATWAAGYVSGDPKDASTTFHQRSVPDDKWWHSRPRKDWYEHVVGGLTPLGKHCSKRDLLSVAQRLPEYPVDCGSFYIYSWSSRRPAVCLLWKWLF